MANTYPTPPSSPYVDFEPYQAILVGLILDELDRDDVWEVGTEEANRANVELLIRYIVSLPQQSPP